MSASPSSSNLRELRRQGWCQLFGFRIQESRRRAGLSVEEAARLSGMESSEWMAMEDGNVPRDTNRLRAVADAVKIRFDKIANLALLCRDVWEI